MQLQLLRVAEQRQGRFTFYLDYLSRVYALGRRRLRSATSYQLLTSTCRLSTVGRQSFRVAAPIL